MIFSKRTTETVWLTMSAILAIASSSIGGFVFATSRPVWGSILVLFGLLWSAFVYHLAQCLYEEGVEVGQREGYQAGLEDGAKAELARAQAEEERQLAEWNEAQSALWAALGDTIRERVQEFAITVHNPNYDEKN